MELALLLDWDFVLQSLDDGRLVLIRTFESRLPKPVHVTREQEKIDTVLFCCTPTAGL